MFDMTTIAGILAIVVPVSVTGCVVAKYWLKPDKYAGKLKKNMEEYIMDLEDENKSLKKTMNAMKKGAKISEEDLNDPVGAIGALIPQFEHLVPAKLKPFLRDPKMLQMATNYIKENPEQAKAILKNFVSKGGKNKELMGAESTDSKEVLSI